MDHSGASDLGVCFLILFFVVMRHIARLPFLVALMRVEGVGIKIMLCRDFTNASVVPSGDIMLTV